MVNESSEPMGYVGFCKTCGAMKSACADRVGNKELAAQLREMALGNLRIEHVTIKSIRESNVDFGCDCKERQ